MARLLCAILIAACAGVACKTQMGERADGESEVAHTFGLWSDLDQDPSLWFPMGSEALAKSQGGVAYAKDDPLTRRVQSWVNAFYYAARQLNPRLKAPLPQVALLRSKQLNAFVTQGLVCMPLQLDMVPAKKVADDASSTLLLLNEASGDQVVNYGSWDEDCVFVPPNEILAKQAMQRVLGKDEACITLSQQGAKLTGSVDANCLSEGARERITRPATQLAYRAIRGLVFYDQGLLFDREEEAIAVVAHEMVHYLRAHNFTRKRDYNFFYEMDAAHNLSTRPTPLPEKAVLAQLGKRVVNASLVHVTPVRGQKLHSVLFAPMHRLATSLATICRGEGCQPCTDWRRFVKEQVEHRRNSIGSFPAQKLPNTEAAQSYYWAYEERVLACAEATSAQAMNAKTLKVLVDAIALKDLWTEVPWRAPASLAQYLQEISEQADRLLKAQNDQVYAIFSEANKRRLGHYTQEQEADELAIELMARLGLDPAAMISMLMRVLLEDRLEGATPMPGVLTYAECDKALSQGFKTFVPIGDYPDSHHSSCFRAYNSFREMEIHRDEIAGVRPRTPLIRLEPSEWAKIRAEVTRSRVQAKQGRAL